MNLQNFAFPQAKIPFPMNDTHKLISRLLASTLMNNMSQLEGSVISVDAKAVTLEIASDTFVIQFSLNTLQPRLPARTCSIEFKKICVSRRPIQCAESLLVNVMLSVRIFGYENVAVLEAPPQLRPLLKRLAFSPTETAGLYIFRPLRPTDIG